MSRIARATIALAALAAVGTLSACDMHARTPADLIGASAPADCRAVASDMPYGGILLCDGANPAWRIVAIADAEGIIADAETCRADRVSACLASARKINW